MKDVVTIFLDCSDVQTLADGQCSSSCRHSAIVLCRVTHLSKDSAFILVGVERDCYPHCTVTEVSAPLFLYAIAVRGAFLHSQVHLICSPAFV